MVLGCCSHWDCTSTDILTTSFLENKLSNCHLCTHQKRSNHRHTTGLVRISALTCESLCLFACLGPLGTNSSNMSKFLPLLACAPSIGKHKEKILECMTFSYQIFSLGRANSGVTLMFKARTLSQNTKLWFPVANISLSQPNLCKSTCIQQVPLFVSCKINCPAWAQVAH